MNKKDAFYGTGRRKSSIARVYLKSGKGSITVNGIDVDKYMPYQTLVMDLTQPLTVLDKKKAYDIECFVKGGGFTGQSGAIRLGITRALIAAGEDRQALKIAGLVTRDPRAKERKKYGLKAARRAPQFSKR